ncbi:pentraxin-related protein PTX3-like [Osmerus eperlanus]|uniref:pentraxin-related protein PTX3-like n=1 Tax=Osmerus eperlanus TaxID=29151 RepID=UPI002E164FC9
MHTHTLWSISMCVCWVCRLVCVLCWMCVSLCVTSQEYEVNYTDHYDNEITQEQQREESTETPCQAAELTRWDKLFVALEDSHMRQNMLLEALDDCCGGMASLTAKVDRLTTGTCQQCVPTLESVCRGEAEQVRLRLQQGLVELSAEGEQRERRINATLQQLLQSSQEQNALLGRLEAEKQRGEETGGQWPMGPGNGGMVPGLGEGLKGTGQLAMKPGGLGAGLAGKPVPSSLKEQDVTSSTNVMMLERALVTIAKELQKVQVQLSLLTEEEMEGGGNRKKRGS